MLLDDMVGVTGGIMVGEAVVVRRGLCVWAWLGVAVLVHILDISASKVEALIRGITTVVFPPGPWVSLSHVSQTWMVERNMGPKHLPGILP